MSTTHRSIAVERTAEAMVQVGAVVTSFLVLVLSFAQVGSPVGGEVARGARVTEVTPTTHN